MKLDKEPIIKVGIQINSTIEFELKGSFKLNDILITEGKYSASILENEIITDFAQSNKIEIAPKTKSSTFILKNVSIGIGFHWEQKETQEFEGGLTLQMEEGKIRTINTVPLESYLRSVISSEMSAMNDLTLLKVHAIVSRSWLLAQIDKKSATQQCHFDDAGVEIPSLKKQIPRRFASLGMTPVKEFIKWYDREDHDTFDVCADDHCQRYQGITKVISANAAKAIESTRGTVLTYNNEICDARFSKCCGGISEDFENVWQPIKVPYLVAVMDTIPDRVLNPVGDNDTTYFNTSPKAFCNTTDPEILSQVLIDYDRSTTNFYRWKVEFSQEEISQLIKKKSGFDFGKIIDLIPLERGTSGRLIKLKIAGTKRSMAVGKELEIRKWLSESHLYSSAFMVEKQFNTSEKIPSKFIIKGAGWGHGVGMCQIGAAVMSKKGYAPEEILKHYFKGVSLSQLF